MNAGSILIGVAMIVLVVPFVFGPLLPGNANKFRNVRKPVDAKRSRKEILLALRDLEFDYQTGKVIQEDYDQLRTIWMAEAADLFKEEESRQLRKVDPVDSLEKLVASRRQQLGSTATCNKCTTRLRAGDRFCPVCGEPTGDSCPSCKASIHPADRFCTYCGSTLKSS